MRRFCGAMFVGALAFALASAVRADEGKDGKAAIDKAIKALGGADKLGAGKSITWKVKGKITFEGNDNPFTSTTTVQGLDHFKQEFEGEFGGNQVKGVTVLAGDKGWRKFGDDAKELKENELANQKRLVYLQVVGATVLPLTNKDFKVESASEEKVGDKPAIALKVTGPDGKELQMFFDKQTGLPVKQVARVAGFRGEEYNQETTFSNYKDFDGVKRATKIESKRDGEKFIEQELSDFKVADKADASAFAQP